MRSDHVRYYLTDEVMATAVGVCTSVVCGSVILVRDRLLKVPDTTTLAELYEKVKSRDNGNHSTVGSVMVKRTTSPGSKRKYGWSLQ